MKTTSSEVIGIGRFKIKPGKLDEYKRLSERCMEIVRTKDSGTLQYDIFVNDDRSEIVFVERYKDSQALIDHFAHLGDELLQAIMATTESVAGEVLGEVSPELRAALATGPVRLFTPFMTP